MVAQDTSQKPILGDVNLDVVCIKAFGDLVIAVSAIEAIEAPGRSAVRLMIGSHLKPLASALVPPVPIRYLSHSEGGVPSLFDVRKNGVGRALSSALSLQAGASNMLNSPTSDLLIDKVDPRIRFIFGNRIRPLPARDNIYQAYQAAFADLGLRQTDTPVPDGGSRPGNGIGIFPGSRLAAKNLPLSMIADVLASCERGKRACRIILLEGERPDVEASGLPHEILPRGFAGLISSVAACDRIISADSLPAHLAERAGIPVFVLSPVDNSYWLPLSSLHVRSWSLFSGDNEGQRRLSAFVQDR